LTNRNPAPSGDGIIVYASMGRQAIALRLIPLFTLWTGIHADKEAA